jgi:hypothetical protein
MLLIQGIKNSVFSVSSVVNLLNRILPQSRLLRIPQIALGHTNTPGFLTACSLPASQLINQISPVMRGCYFSTRNIPHRPLSNWNDA